MTARQVLGYAIILAMFIVPMGLAVAMDGWREGIKAYAISIGVTALVASTAALAAWLIAGG